MIKSSFQVFWHISLSLSSNFTFKCYFYIQDFTFHCYVSSFRCSEVTHLSNVTGLACKFLKVWFRNFGYFSTLLVQIVSLLQKVARAQNGYDDSQEVSTLHNSASQVLLD